MYIKQVIIEGFKSYREQIAIEPFSPRVNCIAGANCSGKTNFFHAIGFVLGNLFHNLQSEDRQALLHAANDHHVLSAFVEIVFDNSDHGILVDEEEVRLKRAITAEKDEYFLNGKHIDKSEVMNLLEIAGFSCLNPYHVVEQKMIASLASMKDCERLDLLKKISGAQVYEERHRESLKRMLEIENKRKNLVHVVQLIKKRLSELFEEKLGKYHQVDKKRRFIQYTIYRREFLDIQQNLAKIENERMRVYMEWRNTYDHAVENQQKINSAEKKLMALSKHLEELIEGTKAIKKQCRQALERHAQTDIYVKELVEKSSTTLLAKERSLNEETENLMNALSIWKSWAEELRITFQNKNSLNAGSQGDLANVKKRSELQHNRDCDIPVQKKRKFLGSGESDSLAKIGSVTTELTKTRLSLDHAAPCEAMVYSSFDKLEQLCAGIAMKLAEKIDNRINELFSQSNSDLTVFKDKLISSRINRTQPEMIEMKLEMNLPTLVGIEEHGLEAEISSVNLPKEIERSKLEQKTSESLVQELEQLGEISNKLDIVTREIRETKINIERFKNLKADFEQRLQDEGKVLQALQIKKKPFLDKLEDIDKKIWNLNLSLSQPFDPYKKESIEGLHKKLHDCSEKCKQFLHGNKNALVEYVSLTDDLNKVKKGLAELDEDQKKILTLIPNGYKCKNELIRKTFEDVARHFREVFSEMQPKGHGNLVMIKELKIGDEHGPREPDTERTKNYVGVKVEADDKVGPQRPDIEQLLENYVGVKVEVSFGRQGASRSMEQLSYGQKKVVALCLIFAIHRCHPAPVCLFDEIDIGLDEPNRMAVGRMIRHAAYSANTQFITSTYVPELVKFADNIYKVLHENGASCVDVASEEDLLLIIAKNVG